MAKASNSTWIFQVIQNAKTLSDLHAIRQQAQSTKDNISVNYLVEEILSVFKD